MRAHSAAYTVATSMIPENSDEAIVQLIGGCQSRLFGYLRGLLCSRELAEDALQETNLILWRKRSQYDPKLSFVAWACQIAFFEACKARQRGHRAVPAFSDVFINGIAPELAAAVENIDPVRERLEECVNELCDRDRELLQRRYAFRADVRSVASSMGCSTHAVYRASSGSTNGSSSASPRSWEKTSETDTAAKAQARVDHPAVVAQRRNVLAGRSPTGGAVGGRVSRGARVVCPLHDDSQPVGMGRKGRFTGARQRLGWRPDERLASKRRRGGTAAAGEWRFAEARRRSGLPFDRRHPSSVIFWRPGFLPLCRVGLCGRGGRGAVLAAGHGFTRAAADSQEGFQQAALPPGQTGPLERSVRRPDRPRRSHAAARQRRKGQPGDGRQDNGHEQLPVGRSAPLAVRTGDPVPMGRNVPAHRGAAWRSRTTAGPR